MPLIALTGYEITYKEAKKMKSYNINYVQVSLDGHNEDINKKTRGSGTFEKIVNSI